VAEASSLNDGLGEKSGDPIDLSSDDSAARVHVAHDEEIKPTRKSLPKGPIMGDRLQVVRLFGIFTEDWADSHSQATPQLDRDPPVQ
jgi:hypothetical protein